MFSCFFQLYMAGSVLNHGAGSSILNRSPLFPRFFEDSVLGSRWGGSYEKSVPLRILGCGQCRYVKSVASKNS